MKSTVRESVWLNRAGKRFQVKCPIYKCRNKLTPFNFEVCHVQSRANGGEDDLDNMTIGCTSCNRRMGKMNYYEYDSKVRHMHGDDTEVFEVEYILDYDWKKELFLVKWKDYPDSANQWLKRSNFTHDPYKDYVWRT